jgi:hypothetical protein
MSKTFSPVEEAVLSLVGNRWWTQQELEDDLYPEFDPTVVAGAVSYLRREGLLKTVHGGVLVTGLGVQLLAEYRRSICESVMGGQLHAV